MKNNIKLNYFLTKHLVLKMLREDIREYLATLSSDERRFLIRKGNVNVEDALYFEPKDFEGIFPLNPNFRVEDTENHPVLRSDPRRNLYSVWNWQMITIISPLSKIASTLDKYPWDKQFLLEYRATAENMQAIPELGWNFNEHTSEILKLPWSFIEARKDQRWNLKFLSYHKDVTWEFIHYQIQKFPGSKPDYIRLSYVLPIEVIRDNPNFPWHPEAIENPYQFDLKRNQPRDLPLSPLLSRQVGGGMQVEEAEVPPHLKAILDKWNELKSSA